MYFYQQKKIKINKAYITLVQPKIENWPTKI